VKPIILTHPAGTMVSVNPLHLMTWGPLSVTSAQGATVMGCGLLLSDGQPRSVLETHTTVNEMFEQAMADLGALTPPRAKRNVPPAG
jgi:hypothetical protein